MRSHDGFTVTYLRNSSGKSFVRVQLPYDGNQHNSSRTLYGVAPGVTVTRYGENGSLVESVGSVKVGVTVDIRPEMNPTIVADAVAVGC